MFDNLYFAPAHSKDTAVRALRPWLAAFACSRRASKGAKHTTMEHMSILIVNAIFICKAG